MRLLLLAVIVVCSSLSVSQKPAPIKTEAEVYKDKDAYEVYAALLPAPAVKTFVVQRELSYWEEANADNVGIKLMPEARKDWKSVLNDYVRQHRKVILLDLNSDFAKSHHVLGEKEIAEVFKNGSSDPWDQFYKRFPSSFGYYWFSAVGFNPEKTRAIVSFNRSCGLLCGGGEPVFLEKKNGKWRRVNVAAEIKVWASE